jgi:hypothetical protein
MTRLICFAISFVAAAVAAQASQPGTQTLKNWKAADLCAKRAQQAFPDYTAEASAKRDAQLKLCLEQQNLPPRAPQ